MRTRTIGDIRAISSALLFDSVATGTGAMTKGRIKEQIYCRAKHWELERKLGDVDYRLITDNFKGYQGTGPLTDNFALFWLSKEMFKVHAISHTDNQGNGEIIVGYSVNSTSPELKRFIDKSHSILSEP